MKISACYIVGGPLDGFEKSIKSIYDDVFEIIVVSTSESVNESLNKLKDKYEFEKYFFPWVDDFSKARNFAIEKSTGDWIIFLDTDEYFMNKSGKSLEYLLEKESSKASVMFFKIYNIDEDNDDQIIDSFFAPRCFRRNEFIRYHGCVHEQLLRDGHFIEDTVFVAEENYSIYHSGYSKSKIRKKALRNRDLLIKVLEKNEGASASLYMSLAEAYDVLGEREKAIYYAQMAVREGRENITYASRAYRILIRLLKESEDTDLYKVVKAAVHDFPELPEFHAEYALCMAERLEYENAVKQLEEAIDCYENYRSLEPSCFDSESELTAKKLIYKWQNIKKMSSFKNEKERNLMENQFQENIRYITKRLKMLIILALSDIRFLDDKDMNKVIPKAFWNCLEAAHGENKKLDKDAFDAYLVIISCLEMNHDKYMIDKVLGISRCLDIDLFYEIGTAFASQNLWEQALLCYEKALARPVVCPQNIFKLIGIAYFYCKDYKNAIYYLGKAQKLNSEDENEIESYLRWSGFKNGE